MKEQEAYMDSIEGKANALRESVKKLWLQVISSDAVKSVIDFLTQCVQKLSNVDSGTIKLIASTGLLLAGLKSIITFSSALKTFGEVGKIAKGTSAIASLSQGFLSLGSSIKSAILAGASFIASPLGLALTAVAVGAYTAYNAYESYKSLVEKPIDTPTENLNWMEKIVNAVTGGTLKSKKELQDLKLAYEDLPSGLSDGFKQAVEESNSEFKKLKMAIELSDDEGEEISDKAIQQIKDITTKVADEAKKAVTDNENKNKINLNDLFSLDGDISQDELDVYDNISNLANEKAETIQANEDYINSILQQAKEEHRQLFEEEKQDIENHTQAIMALRLQAQAENEADVAYSKNQTALENRLQTATPDEAKQAISETYDGIINATKECQDKLNESIAKGNVEIKNLTKERNEALAGGDTEKADAISKSIDTINKSIGEANGKLKESLGKQRDELKTALDSFYKAFPQMEGHFNEVTFTPFSVGDEKANAELKKMEATYSQLDTITQTGWTQIRNTATGQMNDMYVQVDAITGKTVGAYNVMTGEVYGYSEKFKKDMASFKDSVKDNLQTLNDAFSTSGGFTKNFEGATASIENLGNGLGNLRINGDILGQLQNVKTELDGTSTAIMSIKGKTISIHTDSEGAITNLDEVVHRIGSLPPEKTVRVKDDGSIEIVKASAEELQQHIDELGKNSPDIEIQCEIGNAKASVDDVKESIEGLPDDTSVDITINGENFSTVGEVKEALEDLDGQTATVTAEGQDNASDDISQAQGTWDSFTNSPSEDTKTANAEDNASGVLGNVSNWWNNLLNSDNIVTKTINVVKKIFGGGVDDAQATGTNSTKGGRTLLAEEGMELLVNPQIRKLNKGMTVLNNKSTKNYLEAMRLHEEELQEKDIPHHKTGTKSFKGNKKTKQWTYINEGNKGELVELPDGTQIIPNDLSKEIIENSGNTTVNNVVVQPLMSDADILRKQREKIYQDNLGYKNHILQVNTANTLDKPYEDKEFQEEFEEKDTTYMSKDEKKAYQSAKKQYELRKKEWEKQRKEEEKQEKIRKDRVEKEKQYLEDISSEWKINTQSIENCINDLELKETEYGEDITIGQKLDILNQKYQYQSKLIPEAENRLRTYKNTTVTTAEAQEELNKKIEEATDDWVKQKKVVAEAYNEIKKYEKDQLRTLRDTLANAILEEEEKKVKRMEKAEDNSIKNLEEEKKAMIDSYQAQIDALQKQLKALDDNSADEEEKLRRLKKELSDWRKDDSVNIEINAPYIE